MSSSVGYFAALLTLVCAGRSVCTALQGLRLWEKICLGVFHCTNQCLAHGIEDAALA